MVRRQVGVVLGLAILAVAAVSWLAVRPGTEGATADVAASGARVFTSVRDIMQSIVDPSADVLWNAVGTVVDETGFHEALPKSDEEWLNVRHAAVRMIEAGNLLMVPGRQAAPTGAKSETPGVELEPPEITALMNKDRKSFDGFAAALQGLAVEALGSIEAKNGEALGEIGSRMENVCESCHQTFWYPAAAAPQAAGR
jgi:hypothetical protein